MKSITIVTLLTLAFTIGKAQQHNSTPPSAIFVDSVRISEEALKTLNRDNIETIDISKHNENFPNGALYITLKDHKELANLPKEKWLTLKQLADSALTDKDKGKLRMYVLDYRLITDTTNVSIQANRYHSVKIVHGNEAPYFKATMPNILLVTISTEAPPARFILRGDRDL